MKNLKKLLLRGIIKDYALLLTAPMDAPKDEAFREKCNEENFQQNFNGYMLKNLIINQKS